MNTIYDGTFVLGNTSATTYQAGPGISITQPSEGIVRISNDETVLYENNNPTQVLSNTSVDLAESYLNFKELKLYLQTSYGSTGNISYVVTTFVSQSDITEAASIAMPNATNSVMCDSNCYVFTSENPLICYIKSSGGRLNMASGGNSVTNNRGTKLYKVIGINRISGGNA